MKNYNDDNNNNKLISGIMGNLMSSEFYCSIKVYILKIIGESEKCQNENKIV